MHVYTFLTLDPLSPPSWSLSLRPQTKTLVLMVAADSSPDNLFRVRLQKEVEKQKLHDIPDHVFFYTKPSLSHTFQSLSSHPPLPHCQMPGKAQQPDLHPLHERDPQCSNHGSYSQSLSSGTVLWQSRCTCDTEHTNTRVLSIPKETTLKNRCL